MLNFYQMDVNEIERYIRNNSIEASTLTEVLLEKLKEVTGKYEKLTEVLDNYSLCNYDAKFLDTELKEAFDHILIIENETSSLKEDNETLKDEIDNLKHEISYLQNDLTVLKEDF